MRGAEPLIGQERWVLVYEYTPQRAQKASGTRIDIGGTLDIGREGMLALGVEVWSEGISRKAVVVTATESGWEVSVPNRHGAVLHPWGQAPRKMSATEHISWPRAAIRVLNAEPVDKPGGTHHWVLLEADRLPITKAGPSPARNTTTITFTPPPPTPLTEKQDAALRHVFAELLAWPPRLPAKPRTLEATGRHLGGVTEEAIRERLRPVRDRALRLGLADRVGLTDPQYLYWLVENGFVTPPHGTDHRVQLPWLE
ncbi:hypothetical protein [Pseudofrankia inefficax]|uniref:Uncharacterized protein n=1 Tax=Pseudofrankia inefficax (strain DSM 45817 / CECT 9037 / DDB 130130 / EuI1c) TaxID=298654 RepID=E3IZL0_PSEI1|nr:hypothetical protein [Pseudofrankia inefficax]ADP83928.1 hypothetical protein FraEuI1c_5944 [Pseudofrankia inefficax]